MKISDVIATLQTIQDRFGDIEITGGTLTNDAPLRNITVTDTAGVQVWPRGPISMRSSHPVDGVFLD